MKTFVKVGIAAAVSAAALAAGSAWAQDANAQAQNAVEIRQSIFKLMGWNMGPLGGMLRGNMDFDIERVQLSAERMSALAPMIPDAFATDTRGADVETAALDGIWDSQDAFNDKAAALIDALGQLKEAADSGDEGATRQAMGGVGAACGSCHDDFRAED